MIKLKSGTLDLYPFLPNVLNLNNLLPVHDLKYATSINVTHLPQKTALEIYLYRD